MTDEAELRDLEKRLATKQATNDLTGHLWPAENGWHNLLDSTAKWHAVTDATRYLDLRGLLERKPGAPHMVRVREQSDHHEWKCLTPNMYDSTYECQRCGLRQVESIDNPATELPKDGCAKRTGGDHD